jgi:flagellar basal-body rod modification protein FlgD
MTINAFDAINSVNAAYSSASNTTGNTVQKTSDQFMTILLAQLKNQNPMEPMKDSDMMTQMTQLNSLQELQSIKSQMDLLTASNAASFAASLIGKNIKAVLPDGTKVEGLVDGTNFNQGLYLLSVNGKDIPLSSILQITAPVNTPKTTAQTGIGPGTPDQTQTDATPISGASAA